MNTLGLQTLLPLCLIFGKGYGIFHKALSNVLNSPCTLVFFDVSSHFIKDLVIESEENMTNDEEMSLSLTIDDNNFDIASLRKWASCKIGIADISMEGELQKLMFPSDKRQLILVDTNSTNNDLEIKVDKFHHPITIFSKSDERIVHNLACRNGERKGTNYYKADRKSWTHPFDLNPLNFERNCNNDNHPLHGMVMKGSTFGTEPFIQTDPKTFKVIGGVALDIFDAIAEYYNFAYTVNYSTNWYEFNKVGALVGGAAGDVIVGDYDFSLDQPLNMGLGQYPMYAYYTFTNFFELRPKKLAALYNIIFTFDKYIWGLIMTSFLCISFLLYFMYKNENKNDPTTLSQVVGICFGNMFQEYNRKHMMSQGKHSTKLHIMWIVATTFLSMSFAGNLKSVLVQKKYESRTLTVSEMIDKDMLLFMPDTMEMFLENDYTNSTINKRILCQSRKTRKSSQIKHNYLKQFDTLVANGGAGLFIEAEVKSVENKYYQQNKDFPIIMIPQIYMTWLLGFLFKKYDFRVQYIDPVMIKIRDMGIIDHYFSQWESPKNMKEHVEYAEEPLLMSHFLVSGIGWSVGLTLAFLLFLREVRAKSGTKRI